MSVYRDTNTTVTFEHPFPGPLVATVYRGGISIMVSDPVMPVAGKFTIPLTYNETQFDGPLDIVWANTDEDFSRTTTTQVITPLVALSRLQTLFEDTNWTDPELAELENSVRVYIEAYTGQNFGYEIGTYTVVGNGEKRVSLPKRLIKATSIDGGPATYFSVANNGWYLYINHKYMLTIKESPPDEFIDSNIYVTHGVITVPDYYWKQFRVGARYTITGEWGYYTVPEDVQEAAMLLANDFACGDSLYRDRYLKSMKSGDWNLAYTSGAFQGTGNAKADQLLSPYRRQSLVII